MVQKSYDWDGAVLEEHTKKKHEVLTEYFSQYLKVRCVHPQQEFFRLAIVDGFSGAGRYKEGEAGSPVIFIETLARVIKEININRISQGLKRINIECLIIFNDYDLSAIEKLKNNLAPLLAGVKESEPNLLVHSEFLNEKFEGAYSDIKDRILRTKCRNVFFNLDQCGWSHVTSHVIRDIMSTWKSAEVLLTFMIKSFLAYLSPSQKHQKATREPEVDEKIRQILDKKLLNKREWLGEVEKIVFDQLRGCAKYVSPFSINNVDGWQYWLMHFATSYRARQVYNDVLHLHGQAQAHYGRAGLNMLSYEPSYSNAGLYLFDEDSRAVSKESLMDDIPRLISQAGDVLQVDQFYENVYSETPAHSEDIHQAIIDNPDLEVIADTGGLRKKANTIKVGDTIRLKSQTSFIFTFAETM